MNKEAPLNITKPNGWQQLVHIDSNLNWTFDESVDSSTIFKKIRVIGKGGFGTVIEMEHIPSQIHLAGKMINPEMMNRAMKETLQKEIDLMRQIRTPYTVSYYGSVIFNDRTTILMEYCKSGSFRDLMDATNTRLNEKQIKVVMKDLLSGLLIIHTKYNIIHRDIKAGNILLSQNGVCKVADFGVSRQFDKTKTASTVSIVGTPCWMAPEIINGNKYSTPADIWAVGATAVELFEGHPPYSEYPPMKAMVMIATHGFAGFKPESKPSKEFEDFVYRCMTIDVQQRATIPELLQHKFLKDAEDIDREKIFEQYLKQEVVYAGEEEEEELDNSKLCTFSIGNITIDSHSQTGEGDYEEEEEEGDDKELTELYGTRFGSKSPTLQISKDDIDKAKREEAKLPNKNIKVHSDDTIPKITLPKSKNEIAIVSLIAVILLFVLGKGGFVAFFAMLCLLYFYVNFRI